MRFFLISLTFPAIRRAMFFAAALVTLSTAPRTFAQASPEVKRTVLMRHDAPAPDFEAVLVRVELPVGSREGRHTHPGLLLIYVEEGTLTLEYEGKPSTDYKAGDSVIVEAGKIHEGINRGNTPIKVIATFVIPKGATLTTQVK
jgi:quercetin dioxygenase-like cupin family protein